MKHSANAKIKPTEKATSKAITKSISLPEDLEAEAEARRIKDVPEMDWSKYIRGLIRKDLAEEKVAA